jgi:Tfp pilus assembly protein PilF
MKRRVNFTFLACLAAAAAFCVVGGYLLHGYQVRRNASQLKTKAALAKEAHNYPEAVKEYARYLQLMPIDGDARADYALALDHDARSPKEHKAVYHALEKALLQCPSRDDARRRLVDVALEVGEFSAAEDHLTRLMEGTPDNAELEYLRGRSLEARLKIGAEKDPKDGALYWYAKAIQHAPDRIESYVRLADLYRYRLHQPESADAAMNNMVAVNPSPGALLARARYYRTGGSGSDRDAEFLTRSILAADTIADLAGNGFGAGALAAASAVRTGGGPDLLWKAERDLCQARLASPEDAEVLLESVAVARARRWFDQAEVYANRGLDKYPSDVRMYKVAAELAVLVGKRAEAVRLVRKGTKTLPHEPELNLVLADLLITEGLLDEAKANIAGMKSFKQIDPAIVAYLDGRRLVAEGVEWLEASKTLEVAYSGLARHPEMARDCALLLGKCYEQLGDPDQQYRAYRSAFTEDPFDPHWFPAAEGMARSLLALNKTNEAVEAYRKLIPRAPSARLVVARLLMLHNLTLPHGERNWREVDNLIKEADTLLPKSTDLSILRIQVLAAKASYQEPAEAERGYEEALGVLNQARADDPANVSLRVVQAGLEGSRPSGKPADALEVLDRAEKEFTESRDLLELRLARIRFLLQLEGKEVVEGLRKVEAAANQFKQSDQMQLWRGLADAYMKAGELTRARQLWERIADQNGHDLGTRLNLFDLALLAEDGAGMERLVREIQHLEGDEGMLGRYAAAAMRIHRAKNGDSKALEEARSLLATVAGRRPTWARVPVCQARIESLQGNTDGAIRYYLSAVEMGERSPYVLLETIRLLRQRQRYTEAYQVIQRLPEQTPLLRQMNDVVIDLSLRTRDRARALDLATKAVKASPNDYQAHLSMGQVHWALGNRTMAEESIRIALKLKDDVPETWTTLILLLAQNERKEEALQTIEDAQKKLPIKNHRLAYAQCYEAVGRPEKAEELLKDALSATPTDIPTIRAAAAFAIRTGKPKEAEGLLKQLVEMKHQAPEEAAAARRLLGLVLASGGSDYEQKHKILADLGYLDQPRDGSVESPDDKRTRAILLAAQGPRRSREEAIRLLEDISKLQPLTSADQFLLAQLYDSLGNKDKPLDLMRAALSTEQDNPQYLAYFVRVLLARKDQAGADAILARLAKIQPKAWQTVELQARSLHGRDNNRDAGKLVLNYADEEKDPPLLRMARVLEDIGENGAAQTIYERYIAKTRQPAATLLLAEFLGRTGNSKGALELCDRVRAQASPETVMSAALGVLYATEPGQAAQDQVERWIKEALQTNKDDVKLRAALRQSLAALYNLQNRFEEAEATYRLCLVENPRSALSMNNLAWVMATKGKNTDEALAFIQKAIAIVGPKPELLDTRAIVYLAQGKTQLALKDIEEVVADKPTASSFFHRARIHFAAENRSAARDDLRKAKALGLKEKDLHPYERPYYRQLQVEPGVG